MKKQTLFLALGILVLTIQKAQAQVSFGVHAGANFSSLNLKFSDGEKASGSKIIPGFNAGITAEIPVWNGIYFQPGLLFSTKGAKLTNDAYYWFWGDNTGTYTKLMPSYIELPLTAVYKYPLGNGKLIGGAGPYAAYAIGGKWKDVVEGQVYTGKLKFYKNYDDMPQNEDYENFGKRLDIGLNLLAGYEFTEKLSAQINGQFGLRNLQQVNSGGEKNDAKQNTIGFGISIGYRF
ncbi:hypothetical protein A8C56_06335 [Niabella ginsenosidivorans]|uniref:Outer membrane protein beta-barrel domain-containing protein n=1 Tax=Niabella ginsenosidivorans TaxID=1176587 RepID=A0A1A9IAN8_9BACT|nr:porin family protein [Niabella ginsenosidivorans]ANH83741.1 hypothetical protein A8C56_06335 [Niabella ginsenosidivorans]